MQIIKNIYSNLTKSNEIEPLSKIILILIIMLDIFVLVSITKGINANISQFKNQYDYVPSLCRDIVINQEVTNNIENNVQYLVLT